MSRTRVFYALAFCGILITTGGCGSSATAPQAAVDGAVFNRKAPADSIVTSPGTGGDDVYTTSSGFISGGSRSAP